MEWIQLAQDRVHYGIL